jgi:hypothetical protein
VVGCLNQQHHTDQVSTQDLTLLEVLSSSRATSVALGFFSSYKFLKLRVLSTTIFTFVMDDVITHNSPIT